MSLVVSAFSALLILLAIILTGQRYRAEHHTILQAELQIAEMSATSVVEAMSLAMAGGNTVIPRDPSSIETFLASQHLRAFRARGKTRAGQPYDMLYNRDTRRSLSASWPANHRDDLVSSIAEARTKAATTQEHKYDRLLDMLERKLKAYDEDQRLLPSFIAVTAGCEDQQVGEQRVDLEQGTALLTMATTRHGADGAVCLVFDVSHLTELRNRVLSEVVPPTILALAITLGLGILLAWALLAPVRQLAQFAKHHPLGKAPDQIPGETRNDAVGVLARVLSSVFAKTAEQLQILEDRQVELEQALDARSAFLATMSHEIRTPLTGVLGLTELALDGTLDESKRTLLHTSKQSGELLLGVLNDILDYSKLEAGQMRIEEVPVSLRAVISQVTDLMSSRAHDRNIDLRIDIHKDVPAWVHGDAVRLQQIILNLLSNAIKFTEDGVVAVVCRPTARGILIEVEDTGIGMADPDIVFDRFRQAESSTTRRFGGTGLGLSICRALIDAMGGRIDVASTLGTGSTFRVMLPLPACPAPRETEAWVDAASSMRILVAEDNIVNQRVITGLLERLGHQVVVVDNGEAAVEEVQKRRFDAVLMDWMMPIMDGVEATRAIRALGTHGDLPIVALSASASTDSETLFKEAGANSVLGKPIRIKQLAATLQELAAVAA